MNCNNTKVNTLSLSVDSIFRESYNTTSSSNYTFNLPEPIQNVISMKVTAVEIPNFWYMFSSNKRNNEFKIKVYNYKYQDVNENMVEVPSTEYDIIFPDGNYQNIDFVNYLTAYFNNIKGGLDYIIVEICVNTGKTIFRARNPIDDSTKPSPYDLQTPFYSSSFYFTIDFRLPDNLERPIFKNMGWVLGFIKPFYIVNFDKVKTTNYRIRSSNNGVYCFIIEGKASINGSDLGRRDAIGIWNTDSVNISVTNGAKVLLMEVPMDA